MGLESVSPPGGLDGSTPLSATCTGSHWRSERCTGRRLRRGGGIPARGSTIRKQKVVVVGGHPDDPESGCGGTMARLADSGHEVVALYLTRGEAGIAGKSHQEAATIRTAECQEACRVLKARPVFAGQIDGDTEVNPRVTTSSEDPRGREARRRLHALAGRHPPRPSRGVVSDLRRLAPSGRAFTLLYFEVMTGTQTQLFQPTDYVDITRPRSEARRKLRPREPGPAGFYDHHDKMNRFRGLESGQKFAEGLSGTSESLGVESVTGDPGIVTSYRMDPGVAHATPSQSALPVDLPPAHRVDGSSAPRPMRCWTGRCTISGLPATLSGRSSRSSRRAGVCSSIPGPRESTRGNALSPPARRQARVARRP